MRASRCLSPDDLLLPGTLTQGLQALWGLMGLGTALLHNFKYLNMSRQVRGFFFSYLKITLTTFLLHIKNKKGEFTHVSH